MNAEARQRVGLGARVAAAGLVAVFVVGFLLTGSVVVVRRRLVESSFYTDALVRTDAYERVYTEVLADPEFASLREQLLGGLQITALNPTEQRVLAENALRWGVPPSALRTGTEALINAIVAYIRGDTDRLDGQVDVAQVLDRVDADSVLGMRSALADLADTVAASIDQYRVQIASFDAQIASGRVPAAVPVVGGTGIDPDAVTAAILGQLGPNVDARVRDQVVAAVAGGDQRDALITAASVLVSKHAAGVSAHLRDEAGSQRDLDVIADLAQRAGRPASGVTDPLNTVRDAARWASPAVGGLGIVLMLGAAAALIGLRRRTPGRAILLLGGGALAAGVVMLGLWLLISAVVRAPLANVTGSGPGTANLPAGLRALLRSVQSELGRDLAHLVVRVALVPIIIGGALVVAVFTAPAVRALGRSRAAVIAVAACVLVAVVGWAGVIRSGSGRDEVCEGHAELCDRPYDHVAFAATHNAMSSPDVVTVWPEQDGDITDQLDAGVRALLIDTHYWTALVSDEQLAAADPGLSPQLAKRIFGLLGPLRAARDGEFLCHNECALGGAPLLSELDQVRAFLHANPTEVVTLIIQDAITPSDTVKAFRAAGLDRYVYAHATNTPWPTLGSLIEHNQRLVVFAEDKGPPPAWYNHAFSNMQDTPFLFNEPDEFSCASNRGVKGASLFLMNHWIQRIAPDRVDAVKVNARDFIVDRARQCQRERGQMPNYIAVNFYSIGDVVGAVNTLNGVG